VIIVPRNFKRLHWSQLLFVKSAEHYVQVLSLHIFRHLSHKDVAIIISLRKVLTEERFVIGQTTARFSINFEIPQDFRSLFEVFRHINYVYSS
jgi:hypothetical protein